MKFKNYYEAKKYIDETINKYIDCHGSPKSLLVLIRQKYDYEEEYEYNQVPLSCENGDLVWGYDWNEGQSDVEIVTIIPNNDIKEFPRNTIEEACKDYWENKED